jgi:hypothetical protein
MILARNRHDLYNYNEIVGLGAVGAYWKMVLSNDTRVVWNNRFVGGAMLGAIVYANMTPLLVTNLMEKSCEKGQIRMKLPCLT